MKNLVAFVGDVSQKDKGQWLHEIGTRLTDIKIVMFEDLSQKEKNEIKVAIVANPEPEKLMQLPNLTWVQSLWVGVERLVTEMPKATFEISRMVDPMLASTMAEAVLAWVLYLHREMPEYKKQQDKRQWEPRPLVETSERRVSILGLGQLGLAATEKLYFNGFSVNGWSRTQANIEGVSCFSGEAGFTEMLSQTDILVCLLPLTLQTTKILNHRNLQCLPKGASLINFSRGLVLDEDALIELLEVEHLSHAVLDVFSVEPLPEINSLWTCKNVTILPHISAPTNIRSGSKIVSKNLNQYFETGEMPHMISRVKGY